MPDTKHCPHCGVALSADAPGGLCLRCLVQLGVAGPAPESSADTAICSDKPRAVASGGAFGDYELVEEIGHGGMGVVHKARQLSLNRLVALKVIKPGMDSAQVLTRFEAERQALARMDHPNITRVIDAGVTPDGRPFFVMELVEGIPITRFCYDERLTVGERLKLFMSVCHAIQHAHQKGIIHRDIKPSNVLVTVQDGKAVPKVIDFGIAKATGPRLTEESFATGVGALIGTLEYMSPEQAALDPADIDTRSDIYALGILLYELLTGTTPLNRKALKEAAFDEVLRFIRENEPPRPSTRLATELASLGTAPAAASHRQAQIANPKSKIPPDLDWIVMKALEKDRTRRYESATGFAQDIYRYLNHEPVVARPPSAAYRATKLVRKHRVAVVVAACIVVGLIAATLVSTTIALWARREQARAEKASNEARRNGEKAEHERQRAADNLGKAREAVTRYLTAVEDDQRLRQVDLLALRQELLQSAVPFLEEFVRQQSDDPKLEYQRGLAYLNLAELNEDLGRRAVAITNGFHARTILRTIVVAAPASADIRRVLGKICQRLALYLWKFGRLRDAEAMHRETISLHELLRADFPEDPQHALELARSQSNFACFLFANGRDKEAANLYRLSTDTMRTLIAAHPDSKAHKRELVRTIRNVEAFLSNQALVDGKASKLWLMERTNLLEALLYARELAHGKAPSPADQAALAETLAHSADNQSRLGDFAGAERFFTEALVLWGNLVTNFPSRTDYHDRRAGTLTTFGRMLAASGRRSEGGRNMQQSVEIFEQLVKRAPNLETYWKLSLALTDLAGFNEDEGRHQQSIGLKERARVCLERIVKQAPDDRTYLATQARNLLDLGEQLMKSGHLEKAEKHMRKSLQIRQHLVSQFPNAFLFQEQLAHTHCKLSRVLRQRQVSEEASVLLREAVRLWEKLVADFPDSAAAKRGLAREYNHLGVDLARAEKSEIPSPAETPEDRDSEVTRDPQRREQAVEALRKGVWLQKSLLAASSSDRTTRGELVEVLRNLGEVLASMGQVAQALLAYEEALGFAQKLAEDFPDDPKYEPSVEEVRVWIGRLSARHPQN